MIGLEDPPPESLSTSTTLTDLAQSLDSNTRNYTRLQAFLAQRRPPGGPSEEAERRRKLIGELSYSLQKVLWGKFGDDGFWK